MALDPKTVLLKVIDEQGVLSLVGDDLLDGVVKAKLEEIVKDTSNSYDDMLVTMVYPLVKDAVMTFLNDKLAELQPKV